MTRTAAPRVLARPGIAEGARRAALWAAPILALATAPALAGDRAAIDFIGYSEDAGYFAFEEYGIQDGSGFAYSNIYIIDLSEDSWVVGTPIRAQADSEEASLSHIRGEAAAQARDDLNALEIDLPVAMLALVGDGVPDNDGKALAFGMPGYGLGEVSGDYALALSTFATSAASPCAEWFSVDPLGYELNLTEAGTKRQLHRDSALPRSRGCPMDYRIYGVVAPFQGKIDDAVVILSVYPGGFEGPDRRFLAVPLGR